MHVVSRKTDQEVVHESSLPPRSALCTTDAAERHGWQRQSCVPRGSSTVRDTCPGGRRLRRGRGWPARCRRAVRREWVTRGTRQDGRRARSAASRHTDTRSARRWTVSTTRTVAVVVVDDDDDDDKVDVQKQTVAVVDGIAYRTRTNRRSSRLSTEIKLHGCIVCNTHNTVFGSKCSAICAQATYFLHSEKPSVM